MGIAKQEVLHLALQALREKLRLPEESCIQKDDFAWQNIDAVVQILNVDFLCIIHNMVTTANVGNIVYRLLSQSAYKRKPVLLIAKYITPTVVDDLTSNGISTLDCVGNCNIRYQEGDKTILQLINKGEKNSLMMEKTYPAFQEAGLKVIFYLLQDSTNVGNAYREIQTATGVSLGAIKNVFDVLVKRNFILLTEGKRTLKNKSTLLNLWVENYNQVLKPKLLLGKMSFRNNEQRLNWKVLELPEGMYWGGEGGANKIDDYLEPGVFDIYTDIPAANLLKTGMVMQIAGGEIAIYQKFWKWTTENQIAPLILIYADLMGSASGRCIEMAKRLMDYGLQDYK